MGEFGKFEVVIFLVLGLVASTHADDIITGLKVGYYKKTCPNAENIVRDYINNNVGPALAASLLRLHFHDCFVRGCDASVLLAGKKTEKTAFINLSLRGFDVIDKVKSKLEAACPGVVSCADTLALAARDAVHATGGPSWLVPTGRKDGNISNASEPPAELPFTIDDIKTLQSKFKMKGLNLTDLVFLSGAHTIGSANCAAFTNRVYNFSGRGDVDPALNTTYATQLKVECPAINSFQSVPMDPDSEMIFDTSYYKHLTEMMGLLQSDAALLTSSETNSTVHQLASGSIDFKEQFANAMVKMGNIGVLTESAGEVRKNCSSVNR